MVSLADYKQVKWVLSRINAEKPSGPDGVPGFVINRCADRLAGLYNNPLFSPA